MSTLGAYHQWIRSLVTSGYANLKFLDERVMAVPQHKDATCTVAHFLADGALDSFREARDSDFDSSTVGKSRRLFVVEGLSRDWVEKLGSLLDIEPEFFAYHLRATTWEHHNDRSDSSMLPSVQKQARFWTTEYLDCIVLDQKYRLGRTRLLPFNPVFRRMFIRNPCKDQKSTCSIGLVNRFASFWEKKGVDGKFDAVVLADVPLAQTLDFEYDDINPPDRKMATWTPYGGGFVDFADLTKRRAFTQHSPKFPESRDGSMKNSMLWRLRHPNVFLSRALDGVSPIPLILQRIVLSNWTLTLAFLRRDFSSINLRNLSVEASSSEGVMRTLEDLESCRSLLDRCSFIMYKNLRQLGLTPSEDAYGEIQQQKVKDEIELLQMDWLFIWSETRHWIRETDRLVDMRLANLSVLDSRRACVDSQLSTRLSRQSTMLAEQSNQLSKLGQILLLVFTPASFAYGVLSMGGDFLPGNGKFWVFFAIAIPLSCCTLVVFYSWSRLTFLRQDRLLSIRPQSQFVNTSSRV